MIDIFQKLNLKYKLSFLTTCKNVKASRVQKKNMAAKQIYRYLDYQTFLSFSSDCF